MFPQGSMLETKAWPDFSLRFFLLFDVKYSHAYKHWYSTYYAQSSIVPTMHKILLCFFAVR